MGDIRWRFGLLSGSEWVDWVHNTISCHLDTSEKSQLLNLKIVHDRVRLSGGGYNTLAGLQIAPRTDVSILL